MALMIQKRNLEQGLENDELKIQAQDINLFHLFEKKDLLAAWAAYQAGRPLLLRGKPGTGKSQFARALAHHLGWAFVAEVMHGGQELADLHYQYDAVNRLGEAQSLAYRRIATEPSAKQDRREQKGEADTQCCPDSRTVDAILAHENFIRPGCFWWAFDWAGAKKMFPDGTAPEQLLPHRPEDWKPERDGVVLLLDEIDKADPDLPNGLLQTLGDLRFTVPYVNRQIQGDPKKLLIIITTNEERDLPAPLVRRCLSHTLKMGQDNDWLIKRGKLHFGGKIDEKAYELAAELLWQDRKSHKTYPPGLAEYLDLLRALTSIELSLQEQRLEDIRSFVYDKEKEE